MSSGNFIWFNVGDIIEAYRADLITKEEATDYVKTVFDAGLVGKNEVVTNG